MEIALAAGSAAVCSALAAAVQDSPELKKALRAKLAAARSLLPAAEPQPLEVLRAALGKMPVALDVDKFSLDASRRGLSDDDLAAIARALQAAPAGTLLKLNLSHTPVAETSARALAQAHLALASLAALRLRGCTLGDAGVRPICRALHHPEASASSRLGELALASNGLTAKSAGEVADALRELPALLSLDLSYNPLGADGCIVVAEALAERRVLHALSLASCRLNDEGVTRLAAALRDVPLGELDLDGNAASDAAVGALLGMATRGMPLTSLRLSANAIGRAGASAFAAHLVTRPGGPLRTLALSNNPLTPDGCDALRASLRSNHAICELSLTGCGAPHELLIDISEAVARNRQAQRQVSRMHTKSLLRAASAQIAAQSTDGIATALPDDANGGGVLLPPPVAVDRSSSPRLYSVAGTGLPAVPATPADAPYARDTYVADESEAATRAHFDTPAAFASAHGAKMAHAGPEQIAFAPSFAPTGDLSAGVVRQRRELFVLPSARIVLLDGAALGDDHTDELADYLRDNSQTELLHLAGNELTDSGVEAIASALSTCRVRRLSLASNHVQDGGALALAAALESGFAPEQLDLSDNMLADEGATALVRAAAEGAPSLRWLDLRLNPLISDEGRQTCAAASVGASFDLKL